MTIETKNIVGIRFKPSGPIYYFDQAGIEVTPGNVVVVDTARGLTIGTVVFTSNQIPPSELTDPLKPVIRHAQAEDFEKMLDLKKKETEALARCLELVSHFELPMKLLAAEYNLDGTHLTIYFRAQKRVDFRSLLRELSSILKTRVELRQVGARDAAKIIGGLGLCGRTLCCASYLSHFEPISMKMARGQDLSLNPANISGVCNRLLCCLSYEHEQYLIMKQKFPQEGKTVKTKFGKATVLSVNLIKETIFDRLESEAVVEIPLSEIELYDSNQLS